MPAGETALFVALLALEVPVETVKELEEQIGPPPVGGYTLSQLQAGAEHCGLFTLGVQTTVENLALLWHGWGMCASSGANSDLQSST